MFSSPIIDIVDAPSPSVCFLCPIAFAFALVHYDSCQTDKAWGAAKGYPAKARCRSRMHFAAGHPFQEQISPFGRSHTKPDSDRDLFSTIALHFSVHRGIFFSE